VKRALQLAHLHGAELFVVHVTNAELTSTDPAQQRVTDAFVALRDVTDDQPELRVRWIMAQGNPPIELARFIRRTNADLAIVGGALPTPSTGVVGTVAHAIVRATACPVLVIPRTLEEDTKLYREILCGVSSGLSTETLSYALSFAQEFESRLTILNVDDADRLNRAVDMWARTDVNQLRAEIPDSAHEWCAIEELVAKGASAEELVKAAHDRESDLVVVGSTGAPGSDGGLGSVALSTLTLTNASILIVPTAGLTREIDATMAA
jgi:nucleotide-binding universal stress UspA family protein